ncbi:hypothetical protein CWC00_18120 [Pseudoalteromonas rubra]|nr:hypothetical protein CWC00_18120 [Pseudoalteromonas rubra]
MRDDDGVAVGGVVKQGKPGVAAGRPHLMCSKYVGSNILFALMMCRAISDVVSCISPFIQAHTTVTPHLMRDLPKGHTKCMAWLLTKHTNESGLDQPQNNDKAA